MVTAMVVDMPSAMPSSRVEGSFAPPLSEVLLMLCGRTYGRVEVGRAGKGRGGEGWGVGGLGVWGGASRAHEAPVGECHLALHEAFERRHRRRAIHVHIVTAKCGTHRRHPRRLGASDGSRLGRHAEPARLDGPRVALLAAPLRPPLGLGLGRAVVGRAHAHPRLARRATAAAVPGGRGGTRAAGRSRVASDAVAVGRHERRLGGIVLRRAATRCDVVVGRDLGKELRNGGGGGWAAATPWRRRRRWSWSWW